jgi:hypothetical protein
MPEAFERQDRTGRRALFWMLVLYAVTVIGVTVQHGAVAQENNFKIFRAAFGHLIAGRDLYASYPAEHADLYKYSPTTALLLAPFAIPPFAIGLLLWNGLNAGVLCAGVTRLLSPARAALALALVYPEAIGSLQNSQSNVLIAGLVVLAFVAYEAEHPWRAAGALALGVHIKLFAAAGLSIAVMHRRRLWAAAAALTLLAALAVLPILVTDPHHLVAQYRSWGALLAADSRTAMPGRVAWGPDGGVMQTLRIWTGAAWPNGPVEVLGTVLLLLPLAGGPPAWRDRPFRLRFLASLLLYMVLFNHKAESPTFVIAMTGVAIWYVAGPATIGRSALMALAFVVVSLLSGDLTPRAFHREIYVRYGLKTLPCLAVWLIIQVELWIAVWRSRYSPKPQEQRS